MILIDTNVLSEARRGSAEALAALDSYTSDELFVSVITITELEAGCSVRSDVEARRALSRWIDATVASFSDRILPIDLAVARLWGDLDGRLQRQGTTIDGYDGLIAATALHHGLSVMTRNVRHFEPTGVEIVDPWDANAFR